MVGLCLVIVEMTGCSNLIRARGQARWQVEA